MSIDDDFKKAFESTTVDLLEGKTGAGAVLDAPTPEPVVTPAVPVVPADPVTPVATAPVATDPVTPAVPVPVAVPVVVAPVTPVVPAVADPAVPVVPATPVAVTPADPAAPVTPVVTPVVPATPVTPEPTAFEKRMQELEEENKRLKQAQPTPPVAPAAPVVPAAEVTPPAASPVPKAFEYSTEDKAALDDYNKEWPDHAKAYDIKIKATEHNIVNGVQSLLADFAKKIQEGLAPVVSAHLQSGEERHFAAIHAAHADYDKVVDLIPEWIEKQPAFMQATLKQVYEQGASQDVIDLMTRFKQETGRAQPQTPSPTVTTPVTPVAVAPVAPPPAKDKVAALTVVPGQRTSVKTDNATSPDDFASAFNKSVAELTAVKK